MKWCYIQGGAIVLESCWTKILEAWINTAIIIVLPTIVVLETQGQANGQVYLDFLEQFTTIFGKCL